MLEMTATWLLLQITVLQKMDISIVPDESRFLSEVDNWIVTLGSIEQLHHWSTMAKAV
jgi:hypothetical protein